MLNIFTFIIIEFFNNFLRGIIRNQIINIFMSHNRVTMKDSSPKLGWFNRFINRQNKIIFRKINVRCLWKLFLSKIIYKKYR